VAIALNLETFEIISLFHDHLKLSDIDKLVTVYDYLESDLSIFLDLFDRTKDEGILTQSAIARFVQSAKKLARLEEESLKVYGQIGRLNDKKFELEREVESVTSLLRYLRSECSKLQ
jgi:DNA transposition AAA+ family ATPase